MRARNYSLRRTLNAEGGDSGCVAGSPYLGITPRLPVTRPFGELAAASNHNLGAIGDEDLGHASADPASPGSYNRNFFPSGKTVLDSRAESGKVSYHISNSLNSAWRLRCARLPTCLSAS
jgi:hypothetical protein